MLKKNWFYYGKKSTFLDCKNAKGELRNNKNSPFLKTINGSLICFPSFFQRGDLVNPNSSLKISGNSQTHYSFRLKPLL
jgi:hypothetical protein